MREGIHLLFAFHPLLGRHLCSFIEINILAPNS